MNSSYSAHRLSDPGSAKYIRYPSSAPRRYWNDVIFDFCLLGYPDELNISSGSRHARANEYYFYPSAGNLIRFRLFRRCFLRTAPFHVDIFY